MRIELYGVARLRAGHDQVEVEAATVGEAVRALAASCPGVVPEVVLGGRLTEGFLASLNGERFVSDDAVPVGEKDTLLIVSATAGG